MLKPGREGNTFHQGFVTLEHYSSLYSCFLHPEGAGRQAAPRANFMFCFKICGITAWTISTGLLWTGLRYNLCNTQGRREKQTHGAAPAPMKGCSNSQSLDPKGTGQALILLMFCKVGSTSGKQFTEHSTAQECLLPSEVKG